MEVRFRTPTDGNCFYHAVGEQMSKTASKVRMEAVEYLRKNEKVNGEEWSSFIADGERGKRAYLRAMASEGEWADHVMLTATAKALNRRVVIYSQTEKTTIGGETEGEEEGDILVGYIREQHYFGVKKVVEEDKQKGTGKGENKERKEIVAKALDGQRYPLPLYECMWV